MKLYIKYLILVLLVFATIPVFAQEKTLGTVQQSQDYSQMDNTVLFKISNKLALSKGITIPEGSIITVKILDIQDARRWHKSAYLVARLTRYLADENSDSVDLSNKKLYVIIRRYEAIDKKEVGKTAAELTATTAASFVVPGVDIAYYFTKGMIKKKDGVTRFKSGVSTAYENSIFWFWLKGKSLDLDENCVIKIQEVSEEKALKLKSDIERRKENAQVREQRKEAFKEFMSY